MIYVKQSFNLDPASPANRDRFIKTVNDSVLPAEQRLGAGLVGAFFAHEEWYTQIIHVTEFENLAAYGAFRDAAASDGEASEGRAQLALSAPEQSVELVESIGPIATSKLHDAIAASEEKPEGVYTFAILDVSPGKMEEFNSLVDGAQARLPILACWHGLSGSPNRVIDLWKGDTGAQGYAPNSDGLEAFFGPLRQIAPREKMMRLHALPYSPLR